MICPWDGVSQVYVPLSGFFEKIAISGVGGASSARACHDSSISLRAEVAGTLGSAITIEEVPPARLRGNPRRADASNFRRCPMIMKVSTEEGHATLVAAVVGFNLDVFLERTAKVVLALRKTCFPWRVPYPGWLRKALQLS